MRIRWGLAPVAGAVAVVLALGAGAVAQLVPEPAAEERPELQGLAATLSADYCDSLGELDGAERAALHDRLEAELLQARARELASTLNAVHALFEYVDAAVEGAAVAGETEVLGAPLELILSGVVSTHHRFDDVGGYPALSGMLDRLRGTGGGAVDDALLAEGEAYAGQLREIFSAEYPVALGLAQQGGGDRERLIGLISEPGEGKGLDLDIFRETVVERMISLHALTRERAVLDAAMAGFADCYQAAADQPTLAAGGLDRCRDSLASAAGVLRPVELSIVVEIPGLDCRERPCLSGWTVDAAVLDDQCVRGQVINRYGDVGAVGNEFAFYGLLGAEDRLDARIVIPNGPRDRFWRMEAPLELHLAGPLPEAGGGQGTIGPPPDMPPDWAATFSGVTGTWAME
ncbi:MAG: hypothetical protein RLO50_08550 [Azospirillaceae bacterium]